MKKKKNDCCFKNYLDGVHKHFCHRANPKKLYFTDELMDIM